MSSIGKGYQALPSNFFLQWVPLGGGTLKVPFLGRAGLGERQLSLYRFALFF